MNKNIKHISSGTAAIVMALTTAVYFPVASVNAAEDTPIECVYDTSSETTKNVINGDTKTTWKDGDNIVLKGTVGCSYEISSSTVTENIVIPAGANITLNVTATNGYAGNITNAGTLTINAGKAIDGKITSTGTLTINGAEIKDLDVTGGTATINGGTIAGDVAVSAGALTITDGTFTKIPTKSGEGTIVATGGTYKTTEAAKDDDKTSVAALIAETDTTHKAYYSDTGADDTRYISIETDIATKSIVFDSAELVEDTQTTVAGASIEGSNTDFTYTVELYEPATNVVLRAATEAEFAIEGVATFGETVVENGASLKITATTPTAAGTAYRVTATSTIDPSVKKSADFTVNAALTGAAVTLKADNITYAAKTTFDGTMNEEGDAYTDITAINTFLDNGNNSITLDLTTIADKADAEYTITTLVDGKEVDATDNTVASKLAAKATLTNKVITIVPSESNPGEITVRITATSPDGTTVKSRDLKVTVQDVLAEIAAEPVYFLEKSDNSYPSMTAEEFISAANLTYTTKGDKTELADGVEYSITNPEPAIEKITVLKDTDGNVARITPAGAITDDNSKLEIVATDTASGAKASYNVVIKTVTALPDEIPMTAEGKAIKVNEDTASSSDDAKTIKSLVDDALTAANITASDAYTEKSTTVNFYASTETVDEQGNVTGYEINTEKAGTILSTGTQVAEDGTETEVLTAGSGTGVEFMVIDYVAEVNGVETSTTITYKVTVEAELSELSILSGDNDEVKVLGTISSTDAVTTAWDDKTLTIDDALVAGETKTYTIALKSSSIKVKGNPEFTISGDSVVSAGNYDAGYQTFSITAASKAGEEDGKVTVKFTTDEGTNFTVEFNIVTAEYEQINQVIADGIYTIAASKDNGYVLDVAGASTKDGANVQLYQDNGTAAQKFVITHLGDGIYSIKNLKSGLYLSTDYAHGNTLVQVAPVEGGNVIDDVTEVLAAMNSAWYAKLNSDSTITFTNKTTGLTLDIAGNTMKNGTDVRGYAGNNTTAQQFVLTAVAEASTNSYEGGTFTITSALGEDLVLDVAGAGTKNGANINLYESNGTKAQRFTLKDLKNGFYAIVAHTNEDEGHAIPDEDHQDEWLVLDVAGAGTKNGTNVQLYAWNETIAQQWMIVENDDDTITLVSRCNGLVLDIKGAGTKNGTNAQLYTSNGTKAQKFTLVAVED